MKEMQLVRNYKVVYLIRKQMEINTDPESQETDLFNEFKLIQLQWKDKRKLLSIPNTSNQNLYLLY